MPAVNLSLSWTSRRSLNLRECESLNTVVIGHIALSGFLLLSILVAVIPSLRCFTCPDHSLWIRHLILVLRNLWSKAMVVAMLSVTRHFLFHRYLYGASSTI